MSNLGIDFSKITNEWSALVAIAISIIWALNKKEKHTQYVISGVGILIGAGILWAHHEDTSMKIKAGSDTIEQVCKEKISNYEENLETCKSEKDTLKYNLDTTKKQKEGLDKDLVVKNERIKTLKSENRNLTAKIKEQEGQYNFAYKEGYCVVVKAEKYGFKDRRNNVVIPFQFLSAASFSNERAGVKGKNQKWGYIDYSGTVVIPYRYDDVKRFEKDGLAIVTENGKQFKIDKGGRWKKTLSDVKTSEIAMK